jgi:hypothetical protein
MASPDDLAIVPPPPSYPTDTYKDYKPFDDFYERTVDEILDEDANLEGLRDTDWPFYSGGDGAGESPPSYSLRKGVSNEGNPLSPTPRATKKSKAKGLTAKSNKPKKKRPAAKREITVIDLCSDNEYAAPENMDIGCDKTKEQGDPKEVNGIGNLQTDTAFENDSDDTLDFVDAMEDQEDSANVNTVNKKGIEPGPVDVEAVEANVAAGDEIDVSQNTTTKRVRHKHSKKGSKEEKFIFSSVSESVRREVLEFIAEHPFMSRFVQPVKRSARCQFIMDMCNYAKSKGLDQSVLWHLIKYVRRLYLDSAGVDAEPLAPDCNDLPFGQETDDESTPNPPTRKSHKRSRKERSPGIKNKRSKRRLLDVQKPPHPAAVPEVIEIADDSTGPLSPELPDVPGCTMEEKVKCIQIQSTPDSPIGPAVAVSDGAKVQNNVFDPPVIESTPELPSQPLLQTHEICEDTTIVQVESTPELPLESGSATVSHTAETIQIEDIVTSIPPIEETIPATDNDEGSEDAQELNKIAWLGDCANDEAVPESLYEPRISFQTATVNKPTSPSLNSTIDSETNKNLPAQSSKSQKRKARRKLLKKPAEEEKATETMDDNQPALMLPKIVDFGDDDPHSAAQDSATARPGVNDESVSCNSEKSNALPEGATGMIQENLFLDYPSEPTNEAPKKLSKNQQRRERRRAKREKKEKKIQERREKEREAQQQSATSWLKHHNTHDTQDTPMQTLQAKTFQVPKALPKRKIIDPEPRKEKKRKEREHKREQKRERKRKRESLKLELESETNDDDQYQDDLSADKDLELDEQELDSQLKTNRKQERKRQRQSLALPHDKDDIEDDPTSGIQPSNGSIESHTAATISGENEVSPDYDEPKFRVHLAQETPQPEDHVMEKSNSVSTPQPETPVTKGWAIMLTPQRNISTAAPMLTSTPISQCTNASRSRYGPLSPDPTEWDTDF